MALNVVILVTSTTGAHRALIQSCRLQQRQSDVRYRDECRERVENAKANYECDGGETSVRDTIGWCQNVRP